MEPPISAAPRRLLEPTAAQQIGRSGRNGLRPLGPILVSWFRTWWGIPAAGIGSALPIRFPQARGGPLGPLDAATRAFLQAWEERRSGPRGPWIAPVHLWLRRERDTPREERAA